MSDFTNVPFTPSDSTSRSHRAPPADLELTPGISFSPTADDNEEDETIETPQDESLPCRAGPIAESPSPRRRSTGSPNDLQIVSARPAQKRLGPATAYGELGLGAPSIVLSPAVEIQEASAYHGRQRISSEETDFVQTGWEASNDSSRRGSDNWGGPSSRNSSIATTASASTAADDDERPITPNSPYQAEGLDYFYQAPTADDERPRSFSALYLDDDNHIGDNFPRSLGGEIGLGVQFQKASHSHVTPPSVSFPIPSELTDGTVFSAYTTPATASFSTSPTRIVPNLLGLTDPSTSATATRVWRSISHAFVAPKPTSTRSSTRSISSRPTSSRSTSFRNLLSLVGIDHPSSRSPRPLTSYNDEPYYPSSPAMSLPTISVSATASSSRLDASGPRRRKFGLAKRNWKKYLMLLAMIGMTAYVVTSFSGQATGPEGSRNQRVGSAMGAGARPQARSRLDPRMNVQVDEPAREVVLEAAKHEEKQAGKPSGIKFLDLDEDELIAEDDLYYDSLPNFPKGHSQTHVAGTKESSNTAARVQAITSLENRFDHVDTPGPREEDFDPQALQKLAAIEAHTRKSSLLALTHFLAHGGEIPSSWLDRAEDDETVSNLDRIMAQVWKHGGGDGMEDALAPLAVDLPANPEVYMGEEDEEESEDDVMDELAERMRAKLEPKRNQRLRQKAKSRKKTVSKATTYSAPAGKAFQTGWRHHQEEEARLVVFSKSYCPYSRRAKETIAKFKPVPAPYIVELDKRADGPALQSILFALTSRRTVPNILLNYEPLGGSDEIMLLDSEGGLRKILVDAGLRLRHLRG